MCKDLEQETISTSSKGSGKRSQSKDTTLTERRLHPDDTGSRPVHSSGHIDVKAKSDRLASVSSDTDSGIGDSPQTTNKTASLFHHTHPQAAVLRRKSDVAERNMFQRGQIVARNTGDIQRDSQAEISSSTSLQECRRSLGTEQDKTSVPNRIDHVPGSQCCFILAMRFLMIVLSF